MHSGPWQRKLNGKWKGLHRLSVFFITFTAFSIDKDPPTTTTTTTHTQTRTHTQTHTITYKHRQ